MMITLFILTTKFCTLRKLRQISTVTKDWKKQHGDLTGCIVMAATVSGELGKFRPRPLPQATIKRMKYVSEF
jgi:hypothetical protein